jgi:hypothetical protein
MDSNCSTYCSFQAFPNLDKADLIQNVAKKSINENKDEQDNEQVLN